MKLTKTSLKNRKWLRLVIVLVLVAAVAFVGFRIWQKRTAQTSNLAEQQRTTVAQKGTLSVTLSGSGSVKAGQSKAIQSKASGAVSVSYLEEGKQVKAGDVLVELKTEDAAASIKKLENSLKQQELNVEQQQEQLAGMDITVPNNGRISGLDVKVGDSINKGKAICTVVDESVLEIKAVFKGVSSGQLKNPNSVVVHLPDYSDSVAATVESLEQNGVDTQAVITIKNPGALGLGLKAIAEVDTANGNFISEEGTLDWHTQETLVAGASGTVKTLTASNGQYVNKGTILLTLDNDELATALESSQINLDQANDELEKARQDLDNFVITAPFDGILVSVTELSAGDNVKEGTALATLIDTSTMSMEIGIDELDISQVKPGQDVAITLEALEDTSNNPIKGKVESIAVQGTSSNSVTSYPVTITFPGKEGLKVGMNAEAIISILNKKDVLLVPFESVQKRGDQYYVWVSSDGVQMPSGAASGNNGNGPRNGGNWGQGQAGSGNGSMPQISEEQRQQFENMTDEERQQLRQQFMQQGSGATGQAGNTTRRSGNQNSQNYYSGATQVVVTVGDYNATEMEITSGLKEGDVVVLPQIVASTSTGGTTQNWRGGGQGVLMQMGNGGNAGPAGGGGFGNR